MQVRLLERLRGQPLRYEAPELICSNLYYSATGLPSRVISTLSPASTRELSLSSPALLTPNSPTCSDSPSRRSTVGQQRLSPELGRDLPRLLEQVPVRAEPREAEVGEPRLPRADELSLAPDLEVAFGELEAVGRRDHRLEALEGRLGELVACRETRRQYDCSAPRPTRPRSWWSWASPNRSASWTIMIVALGTSTPTSITVVATRTSSSPALNAAITALRSPVFSRPCTQPTR